MLRKQAGKLESVHTAGDQSSTPENNSVQSRMLFDVALAPWQGLAYRPQLSR